MKSSRILAAIFSFLISATIFFNFSFRPNQPEDIKRNAFRLFPVGWNLFARTTLKENYTLYKIESKQKLSLITLKNFSGDNLFGLSRKARKIDAERQYLMYKIPDSSFIKKQNTQDLISGNQTIIRTKVWYNSYLEKGDYLLVKKKLGSVFCNQSCPENIETVRIKFQ